MRLHGLQRGSQGSRQAGRQTPTIALSSVELCSATSTLFAGYRCASTARSARPSGVDVACAQLTDSICAMAAAATTHPNQRALTAVLRRRIFEGVTFVLDGTPSRRPT
jgi:hypothetical protein